MKQQLLPIAVVALFSSSIAATVQAGYTGPGATPETVSAEAATAMNDDQDLILEGFLIEKLQDEHYTFRDESGEISVEIDDHEFRELTVGPETKLRIIGEVDRDLAGVSIEADRIEIITNQ